MTVRRTLAGLTLLLGLAVLFSAGCDKINKSLSNIPGKVQGQCLDSMGAPRGYVSVILKEVETGKEKYQMNAEDSGNFMFTEVDPGKYIIVTKLVGQVEIPNDCQEFNVTPGKTVSQNVVLKDAEKKDPNA